MEALSRFLAMGGYAVFVWPAYGVALLVLLALLVDSLGAYRRRRRELAALDDQGAGSRR